MTDRDEIEERLAGVERSITDLATTVATAMARIHRASAEVLEKGDVLAAIQQLAFELHTAIRTQRVEILNAAGQAVLSLDAAECGGRCLLGNSDGVAVVILGADEAGGVIGVQDHAGQPRATLQVLDDGRGRIGAMAPDGRTVSLGP